MILLDAYALVAFFVGGPAAASVRAILRESRVALTTVNLAEALDVSERVHGVPVTRGMEAVDHLLDGTLVALDLTTPIASRAAAIRAKHYHRSTRPISLADAVLLASARVGDRIATADPDVIAVAELEGLGSIVLPEQGAFD